MNQRYLLTVVALFSAVLGMPSVSRAQATKQVAPDSPVTPTPDVVKVGEYQSQTKNPGSIATTVTEIHTHDVAGRQAATLYVRGIPVLTFMGQQPIAQTQTKIGTINTEVVKVGSSTSTVANSPKFTTTDEIGGTDLDSQTKSANDPVQRAGVIAAKINQLIWEKVDASKITVSWQAGSNPPNQAQNKNLSQNFSNQRPDRFVIKVNNQELVTMSDETRLAGGSKNPAQDALQATNRLRRLIGNASPLTQVDNLPKRSAIAFQYRPQDVAIQAVRATFRGVASFYGYDFSGNRTATGERFNPEGMTAAHRTLPFGTRVRVTNTRNGRSVIVRINDRGPFIRGRVIDLSTGAARLIGMINSGVAPVLIEVLGR
ncbi:septal ring lytic transglycosylase RlpA family protein [Calothrix sp. 336/3]|uniref:septal ring lytic transglycosylase RlpA family protein n=1 Tax=Calothrix sp. 336/3 TaxID=1337936 RepID=UPI0004E2C081|nr:septal ring lytic transglycosylase RlpA family protein [Calothrix sp. 336/3]AKG22645.1 RlpA [Calothrix sp. 336/3]